MDVTFPQSITDAASRQHQPITSSRPPLTPLGSGSKSGGETEVRASLLGFEGVYALLSLAESSELIRWPKNKIPTEAKIGDQLILEALSLKNLKEQELSRMRTILEELIN